MAIRGYGRFVADGLQEGYRPEFHRGSFEGRALGKDSFIEEALARDEESVHPRPSIDSLLEAVCSVYGLTKADVAKLGKCLHQDLSSLSQAARRLELRVKEDARLKERLETVKKITLMCQA